MYPAIVTTKMANKTITVAELQEYLAPPHCTASNRQSMLGRKRNVPSRSKRGSLSLNVDWVDVFGAATQFEISNKMHDDSAKGKLIKKHQRHEAYCVRRPPSLAMSAIAHFIDEGVNTYTGPITNTVPENPANAPK
jgi:hypothetical protein